MLTFGAYDMLVEPGTGDELVISVASLGAPDRDQVSFEWGGLLRPLGDHRHVIYLRDRRFSWYNNPEGWDELVGALRAYLATHGIRRSIAFGLSMGGYGALALAAHVPLSRVVALGPQVAIGEDAGWFDDTYHALWRDIAPLRWPSAASLLRPGTEYVCCFSRDVPQDVQHAGLLRDAAVPVRLVEFHGDHNLGGELQYRGLADVLVHAILAPSAEFDACGGAAPTPAIVEMADAFLRRAHGRPITAEAARLIDEPSAASAPDFLYPRLHEHAVEAQVAAGASWGTVTAATPYPAAVGGTVLGTRLTPYLPYGWWSPEATGTWSAGRWHVLRARLLDASERATLLLSADLFLPAGRPHQRVRFHDRGYPPLEVLVEGSPGLLTRRFVVPVTGPLIELSIETPDALSPAACGMGQDTRTLALMLVRLSFAQHQPADAAGPPMTGASP